MQSQLHNHSQTLSITTLHLLPYDRSAAKELAEAYHFEERMDDARRNIEAYVARISELRVLLGKQVVDTHPSLSGILREQRGAQQSSAAAHEAIKVAEAALRLGMYKPVRPPQSLLDKAPPGARAPLKKRLTKAEEEEAKLWASLLDKAEQMVAAEDQRKKAKPVSSAQQGMDKVYGAAAAGGSRAAAKPTLAAKLKLQPSSVGARFADKHRYGSPLPPGESLRSANAGGRDDAPANSRPGDARAAAQLQSAPDSPTSTSRGASVRQRAHLSSGSASPTRARPAVGTAAGTGVAPRQQSPLRVMTSNG